MGKGLKSINLISLFFIAVLLTLLIPISVYIFSYCAASLSGVKEKASETVYNEDLMLTFSSLKSSYMPGENATFYIDVLNLRDFPIYGVNFSLNIKASSLFGLNVYSVEDSSTRVFTPGRVERLRTLPEGAVEVTLPEFIPPGFYTLELSAKPAMLKPPLKASITIYVEPSTLIITVLLTALIFSGAAYILLTLGTHIDVGKLSNTVAGRLALFSYSMYIKSQEVDVALRRTLINLSIGQKFVFLGICSLITAPLPLMLRFEGFANDLAILAYFSLVIGVINLFWETSKPKIINLRLHPSIRLMLSLITLVLLTYFSKRS